MPEAWEISEAIRALLERHKQYESVMERRSGDYTVIDNASDALIEAFGEFVDLIKRGE